MHCLGAQTLLNRLIFNLHGETLKIAYKLISSEPQSFVYRVTQKIQEVCLQGDQKTDFCLQGDQKTDFCLQGDFLNPGFLSPEPSQEV